jgi:salicylate hydroxylase
MTTTPDVIVAGGGIGGLSAAYALSRKGLRVRLYERAAEFGEVGAGLQIASNCTRILDQYGLHDEAKRLGVVPDTMIMRDGVDGTELTRLDLRDVEKRYGTPYLVIHRTDLSAIFLRACQRAGVELILNTKVTDYQQTDDGASVTLADGSVAVAPMVVAADGIHSVARNKFVGDPLVNSSYVAYRGTVPADEDRCRNVDLKQVVVYVGPRFHFVHYGLRGGQMLNQVAVFQSPKALAGEEEWGTPDEMEAGFTRACAQVKEGLPFMWRDRCWRMYTRNPVMNWVYGRVALLGDSAHPPLQYIAQGAIMAIEDGWVLANQAAAHRRADGTVDWDTALAGYNAVRPEHCRRVLTTSVAWGELWHHDGVKRQQRNIILRARDTYDYSFVDWLYGHLPAMAPQDEPTLFTPIPLDSVQVPA